MKRAKGVIFLGLTMSLILAACASQLGTPETSAVNPESSPTAGEITEAGKTIEETDPPLPTEVPATATPHQPEDQPTPSESKDYQIITLLPPDAIPAIDNPVFLTVEEADAEYAPDEEVLGVVFDGEARAYSVPLLSSHEIVNDTVAGRKIAVTW